MRRSIPLNLRYRSDQMLCDKEFEWKRAAVSENGCPSAMGKVHVFSVNDACAAIDSLPR